MNPETMENLGFTNENSIETELDRKKEIAKKFIQINEDARKNMENYFKEMYKNNNSKYENE